MQTYQLTIPYSDEVLWALQQQPKEFERDIRRLAAMRLYETGRLSSGLAAQLAGMGRVAFLFALSEAGLSPFGEMPSELTLDWEQARAASHRYRD
jgi:predicted HTH domain antitoxin